MANLGEIQRTLAELREARDAAAARARRLSLTVERLAAGRAELARLAPGSPNAAEQAAALDRRIAELDAEAVELRARESAFGERFAGSLAEGIIDAPIEELFGQLDDHTPFLLFPVRLETKFSPDRTALRVRIFPDDVLISTHDPLLSDDEVSAGQTYWAERAVANALAAQARRTAELGAWRTLAARFGGPRARYVARRTKPASWPPLEDGGEATPPAPDEPRRLSSASAPPRARLLPDRFVVMALDASGVVVAQAAGRPIPDELALGPDVEAAAAEIEQDAVGRLALDPKLAWLVDYDRAVDVGMAVTLPVERRFSGAGFDRVIALGVKLALDSAGGASALEELFAAHRFTSGIDLLRQGSPTNNTEGAPSAFASGLSVDEALFEQEVAERRPTVESDHAGKSDAQRLSEALGISFEAVADWPSVADSMDVADALAMNRALWPSTFGTYLRELVGNRMPAGMKADLERFFLTYVTGRSLLPAIRVGAQPYGVLASGDLGAWAEPPGSRVGDMAPILDGIRWMRDQFEAIAAKPDKPVAQLGRGADTLDMAMRVIGQQASSVAFASRKAVTDEWAWNTLEYQGVPSLVRRNWWAEREKARDDAFAALGIDRGDMELAKLVYFQDADVLAVPVVDRDPEIPLSETEEIARFDGARNYIDWLLTATSEELRAETFKDADGTRIPPPPALLYRLLRQAVTAQLANSSIGIVTRLRPELLATTASSAIVNVGETKVVPETRAPQFDAARLGLGAAPRLLGDHLLELVRGEVPEAIGTAPEALPLQSQTEALRRLARLPTAALERVFAEHLDLTCHRLDAWQTGLFSRRLDHLRRRDGRGRGIYLGAYGYVEGVAPKPPARTVPRSELPELLREESPVLEQIDGGGFVHAPSLNQAVTAAVLRNAYLTHAEPARRAVMSVNLTSRRVRSAMGFIEGIRAGQELAALLGYHLERGLHENHPGQELDAFIYVLRERFPLISRRLTDVPEGTRAEVIEARNVVDGWELIEHVRARPTYPYGIDGLPPAGAAADAIAAEIDRLEEALDAVADLMLAESVHHAVQSNADRARGVIGAIAEGEMPPVPEVVQTPRSGRVLTERVALHLPEPGAGWLAVPTPRAAANPRLNTWLTRQLPPPNTFGFSVRSLGAAPETVRFDWAGLEAIDLVLMCGDRFGERVSELERHIADRWRAQRAVPDGTEIAFARADPAADETRIVIDLSVAGAIVPLARILVLLRALRRLVGGARGLTAQDYRLSIDSEKADPANPKGYALAAGGDLAVLPERIGAARDALGVAVNGLDAALTALAPAYDTVRADPSSFDAATWSAPLTTLRARMRALTLFGVPEARPRSAVDVTADAALGLVDQGRAVLAATSRRLAHANEMIAPLPSETPLDDPKEEARRIAGRLERRQQHLAEAGQAVLGAGVPLAPAFALAADARIEIQARLADPIERDALVLETWLQSLARVRPRLADLALVAAGAKLAAGTELRLTPVQLPLRESDPWIGKAWTGPLPDGELMSVMALDAPGTLSGTLEGLLIDDWTETVPTEMETTGVAFHFDRPNATAPQALLVCVPSDADGRWTFEELRGVVTDTFAQARLRAIEPDDVAASRLFPLLPAAALPFYHSELFASTFLTRDLVRLNVSE